MFGISRAHLKLLKRRFYHFRWILISVREQACSVKLATGRIRPSEEFTVTRKALYFWLFVFVEAAVFAGLLIWIIETNSPVAVTLLIIDAIAMIPIMAWLAFCLLWNPMVDVYLPQKPNPNSVHRSYQSFSLGVVNMGLSIHAAADSEHLHLRPIKLWRLLGAHSCSIPWASMDPMHNSKTAARVDGRFVIRGPLWCMQLMSPEESSD